MPHDQISVMQHAACSMRRVLALQNRTSSTHDQLHEFFPLEGALSLLGLSGSGGNWDNGCMCKGSKKRASGRGHLLTLACTMPSLTTCLLKRFQNDKVSDHAPPPLFWRLVQLHDAEGGGEMQLTSVHAAAGMTLQNAEGGTGGSYSSCNTSTCI